MIVGGFPLGEPPPPQPRFTAKTIDNNNMAEARECTPTNFLKRSIVKFVPLATEYGILERRQRPSRKNYSLMKKTRARVGKSGARVSICVLSKSSAGGARIP